MKKSRFLGKAAILLALCALALLTACDNMMDSQETKTEAELATLSISVEGAGARTVTANRLPEYTEIRLYRGLDGEADRELLGTFAHENNGPAVVTMTPGTYNFSLELVNQGLIVGVSRAENITLTAGLNELAFSPSPPAGAEGNGYVEIALRFPNYLGITTVMVKNNAQGTEPESLPMTGWDGYYNSCNYNKYDIPQGDYLLSFLFYKGDKLVGVTSEIVKVKSGFGSDKDIDLSEADFYDSSVMFQLNKILATAEEGGSYTITVAEDEILEPINLWFYESNITITLTGGDTEKTLRLDENFASYLFSVSSGITLILGNNITLRGHDQNTGALVAVYEGGTLELQEGAKITGNSSSYDGGGVYVTNNGTFTMSGGEISGNSASYNGGGGVYVDGGGTFTMSGGEISGNSSSYNGGGVYVDGGTFTMSGGVISGNSASYNGGGVLVWNFGTFAKTGGLLHGNDDSGVDDDGLPLANVSGSGMGHAAFWQLGYYRDASLGESDNLGTDSKTNWITPSDMEVTIQVGYGSADNPTFMNSIETVLADTDRVFEISGDRWITWQWYVNGELQPEATSSTYTFNRPAGQYELFVVVTDEAEGTYSGSCLVKAY